MTERDWAAEIGEPAFASVAEMVAALECDYDRLQELRDDRDGAEDAETWASENPEEAEELRELEEAAGECEDREAAQRRIEEDALSVEIRSGWSTLDQPLEAEEFMILLTTGGPAVRIVGELDEHRQPSRAWLEVQDWGKPWTEYVPASGETLLAYAGVFYFGE
jgi:hypothetical protein